MKKILFLLFFPISIFSQEQLTLDNILTISDKNSFLKEVIENGYSEGNSTKDKIYYGKGFKKKKHKQPIGLSIHFQMESFILSKAILPL